MEHTYSCVWVHLIWATKNRERILYKDQGQKLFDFLINKDKEVMEPVQ